MRHISSYIATALALLVSACSADHSRITALSSAAPPLRSIAPSLGPDDPHFNLEVILRGDGFGHVSFRQRNDVAKIIDLDTWVRGLDGNTDYLLQRAVDTTIDGNCTGSAWLTLGAGLTPLAIRTDEDGTGRAALWRDVTAIATGSIFDIHFRVIEAATAQVVLTSDCYQYFVKA